MSQKKYFIDLESKVRECTKCNEVLPFDNFAANKYARSGRLATCKACLSWRGRDKYVPMTKPDVFDADKKIKSCVQCGEVLPFDGFSPLASGRGGRKSKCRACSSTYGKEEYVPKHRGFLDVEHRLKECQKCRNIFPFDSFSRHPKGGRGGLNNICKKCNRWQHIQFKYGLTQEQHDKILLAQNGVCAICKKAMEFPHVDHCHATEKVRGILCHRCNPGLGLFEDDAGRLEAAADYLRRSAKDGYSKPNKGD